MRKILYLIIASFAVSILSSCNRTLNGMPMYLSDGKQKYKYTGVEGYYVGMENGDTAEFALPDSIIFVD